jgi:1-acyl-sn-glycerol-3-phosphate acyltransferase
VETLHLRIPRAWAPGFALDVFTGKERDLTADCAVWVRSLGERVRVEGIEHIPMEGPLVIVGNHLQGPGLWIGWATAAAVDAIVKQRGRTPVHVMVSVAYDRASVGGVKKLLPGTRWMFDRVAKTWGMIPVHPDRVGHAARQTLRAVGSGDSVAIYPEGAVQGVEGLFEPQESALKLIDLTAKGARILPAAHRVKDGRLECTFGPVAKDAREAWGFIAGRVPTAPGAKEWHDTLVTG